MIFFNIKFTFFTFILLLTSFSFSQYGKYEIQTSSKGRLQLIDTETKQIIFDKCLQINSISEENFKEVEEDYQNYLLVYQKKKVTIFNFKEGENIETIPCDDVSFYEIENWQIKMDTNLHQKKKQVIYGTVHSQKSALKNSFFMLNVVTGKTVGFYPDVMEIRYNYTNEVLIYKVITASAIFDENFKNINNRYYTDFRELETGNFIGKDRDTERSGAINKKGEVIIPFEYQQIGYIDSSLYAALDIYGRVGVISSNHQIVIPFQYDCYEKGWGRNCNQICKKLNNETFLFAKGDNIIILDTSNYRIGQGKYISAQSIGKDFAAVKSDKYLYGVINLKQKREIIPCEYENYLTRGKYFIAFKNKRLGVFDTETNAITLSFIYEDNFKLFLVKSEWYAILETAGRKGLFNLNGKEIIPCIYDDMLYKDDYLLIKHKGLYGLIETKTFKEILPIEFTTIDTYRFKVEKFDGEILRKGSFDKEGKVTFN